MVTLMPAHVPAARRLGVVIGLHGAGATARDLARQLSPAMTAAGITSFAAVTVDGGDTYWHKRADGDDPLGMIIGEVLPRLAAAGLATARIGISGESMGGYGALLLAEHLASGQAGPVEAPLARATAKARGRRGGVPRDLRQLRRRYRRQPDVLRQPCGLHPQRRDRERGALRDVPCWIGCGTDDPFEPEAARLRDRLAAITGHQPPGGILAGCHDDAFWGRNLPAALTFLSAHLG